MTDETANQIIVAIRESHQKIEHELGKKLDAKLKGLATKDDLKAFATKEDLRASEERIKAKIASSRNSSNKHHIETRNMIGGIENALGELSGDRQSRYEM